MWDQIISSSNLEDHPAQLVWVDPRTAEDALAFWCERDCADGQDCLEEHPGDVVWASTSSLLPANLDELSAALTVPVLTYRTPPIPAAWCVLGTAVTIGTAAAQGRKHDTIVLRGLEWQHRDDGSVIVVGYTAGIDRYGKVTPGGCVPAVLTPDGTMLSLAQAQALTMGTLVTGHEAPPPLYKNEVSVPRVLQRTIVHVAHLLWERWERGLTQRPEGELIDGDFEPGQTHVRVSTREVPGVHVVRAYRPRAHYGTVPDGEHARTEPGYRWKVRGHWRLQPCGPRGTQRRKIWVEEHVSGPPDKPVRDTPTVIAL
jgi:hypothetical protein